MINILESYQNKDYDVQQNYSVDMRWSALVSIKLLFGGHDFESYRVL